MIKDFEAKRVGFVALRGVLLGLTAPLPLRAAPLPPVVVADFDYADTSGEIKDQSEDHRRRIAELTADIVVTLSKDPRYASRRLSCGHPICSVDEIGSDGLIDAAKTASARYLVYGGVHKSSTLVEWLKIEMVDLDSKRLLASRLLTFRGDSDEAYKRAARFVADEMLDDARCTQSKSEGECSRR